MCPVCVTLTFDLPKRKLHMTLLRINLFIDIEVMVQTNPDERTHACTCSEKTLHCGDYVSITLSRHDKKLETASIASS